MNLSNSLTLSRIIIIPFFLFFLIKGHIVFAIIVFCIACLTDTFDGIVARSLNQKTKLGFFLDPIADKLLINISFITMAVTRIVPLWLSITVFIRDIIIVSGVIVFQLIKLKHSYAPTTTGKITTMLQMLTILLALLKEVSHRYSMPLWFFIFICTFFTLLSGMDYVCLAIKMLMGEK